MGLTLQWESFHGNYRSSGWATRGVTAVGPRFCLRSMVSAHRTASTARPSIDTCPRPAHRRRSRIECTVAFPQPPSVQGVETRPLERLRGASKTFVSARCEMCAGHRTPLFEIPLQLLDGARVKGGLPVLAHDGLERLVGMRELERKHESQCPRR